MSGLFSNKYAPVINILGGIRVQTSLQGLPIPILYGRTRMAPNLIWYGNFFWRPVPGQKKGSGSGGSGKKGAGEYDYGAAVILALCQGPIQGIGATWNTQGNLPTQETTETYTVPGPGGSYTATQEATYLSDLGVSRGDSYSVTANDFGSPGSITLTGTQQTPMTYQSGGGSPSGAGYYTRSGTDSATYNFSSGDAGKTMSITYAYSPPFTSGGVPVSSIASIGFTLFNGLAGQLPWSYLTSNFPSQAIGYSTLAYLATPVLDLGVSGALPNFNFEVYGLLPFGGGVGTGTSGLYASDNFQTAGALSGNWTVLEGTWLVNSQGGVNPSAVAGDNTASAAWTEETFGPDQYCSFYVSFGNTVTPGYFGPAVRMSTASETYYAFLVVATNIWALDKVVAGTRTNLANGTITPQGYPSLLAIQVQGSTITCYINGQLVTTVTDTSITSGQPGMAAHKTVGTSGFTAASNWTARQLAPSAYPSSPAGDCNPSDVLGDIFTNPLYGCNVLVSELGNWTSFSNYCIANGLFISPLLDSARTAADWIKDILDATNSEIVESGGLLNIISYGDTTVVGNGVTFTPQTQPIYDLTADDFIRSGTTPPIQVNRPSIQDAYNSVRVEYLDRGNSYNPTIVEAQDLQAIQLYKYRPEGTRQYHMFCQATAASQCAATALARLVYIRNQYKFKLPQSRILLDPMDLVTIPVGLLGMSLQNLLADAFAFENTVWNVHQVTRPSGPTIVAPDGNTTAEALVPTGGATDAYVGQSIANPTVGSVYSFSVWLRVPTGTKTISIFIYDVTGTTGIPCALTTTWQYFSVSRVIGTGATYVTSQIGGGASWTSGEVDAWGCELILPSQSVPVRILTIDEADDRTLDVTAEEFPWGTAGPTLYPKQSTTAGGPNAYAPPGGINPPIIFEALSRLNNQIGHAIWFGLSGPNANWGGCRIWVSTDGATYKQIATEIGQCVMGSLTAALPFGSDPDTTNTLAVDVTESFGVLNTGNQADADANSLLTYVGNGENLLLYSQAFDNADWTKNQVLAPTANTVVAPDGTTTAEALIPADAGTVSLAGTAAVTWVSGPLFQSSWVGKTITINGTNFIVASVGSTTSLGLAIHIGGYPTGTFPFLISGIVTDAFVGQASGVTAIIGETYTFSVWLKVTTGTLTVNLYCYPNGQSAVANPITITTAWQRFSASIVATAAGNINCQIGGGSSWINGEIDAWGGQLELSACPHGYNPTTSATESASAELISYETATLTSAYNYDIGTYMRRGVFNSTIAAHAYGSDFLLFNDQVEGWDYDVGLIGTTVFFKFTSFNQSGLVEEELADATPYPFPITGASIGLLMPAHASYRPDSNPLTATDAGASATINIAGFDMIVPGQANVVLGSGAITGLSYNTLYYVYFSDPGFISLASPTYLVSTTKTDAIDAAGFMFVGSILTPISGGTDTAGNNDGGGGAQIGMVNLMFMSASEIIEMDGTGSVANPAYAIDGNPSHVAQLTLTSNGTNNNRAYLQMSGPPGITRSYYSANLIIIVAVPTNSVTGYGSTQAIAGVEIDWGGGAGGFSEVLFDNGVTQATETLTVPIPNGTNLSLIKVTAYVTDETAPAPPYWTSGSIELDVKVYIEADE